MSQHQALGDMLRGLVATLTASARQNAAEAVNQVLTTPLKRAARKAMFLGLGCGLSLMAGICLALAFFHVLLELFGVASAAYGVTFVVCLLVGALCLWVVLKDGKKPGRGAEANAPRAPEPSVGPDPGDGI